MKLKTTFSIIASIFLFALFSCSKQNEQLSLTQDLSGATAPEEIKKNGGIIYVASNDANTNDILSYSQNSNGSLSYLSTTASGGNGSNSELRSQGSLQISADKKWLFAVNAGSNSISSFAIDNNGGLTLASTVSSDGLFPVSLTVRNDFLYVVNLATATISGFTIGSNGSLTFLNGSRQALSQEGATPAQISFSPYGNCLLVTEKMTNKITRFPVNSIGVAGPGSSMASANTTPFGFDFSDGYVIISEAAGETPNSGSVSSYFGSNLLSTPSWVSGPIYAGQTASGWVEVTSDGKYAYVSNTGCNTLSLFGINHAGIITAIDPVTAITGTAPADLTLSSNENFLYAVNSMSHSISAFRKKPNGSLQSIDEINGLPPFAAGLAAF